MIGVGESRKQLRGRRSYPRSAHYSLKPQSPHAPHSLCHWMKVRLMEIMREIIERAKKAHKRIVLPERDGRVVEAAVRLHEQEIAAPILLGSREEIAAVAKEVNVDVSGIECVNPAATALETYAQAYVDFKGDAGLSVEIAARLVKKPLFYGAMMVNVGDADGLVAGAATTTANVLRAGTLAIGTAPGTANPSSFFIMIVPGLPGEEDRILIFADAAVILDPDPEALADIAIASARSARSLLGIEPKVALLSCSTKGSTTHERIDTVVEAVEIVRRKMPDLEVDGELQGDAALLESVGRKKAPGSMVAGRANVLVFPDLNSGNIAYKLVQCLAHARAIGPLLQGFAKPICDLSRGASVQDIVDVVAITSLL